MTLYLVRHKYGTYILTFFTNQVRRNNRRNCDWLGPRSASDWLLFRRDLPTYVPKASHELSTDHRWTSRRAPWRTLWGSPRGTPLIHVINTWCTMSGRCLWQLKLPPEFVTNNFGNFEVVDGTFYLSSGCNFNTLQLKQNDSKLIHISFLRNIRKLRIDWPYTIWLATQFFRNSDYLFLIWGFEVYLFENPTVFQLHLSSRNSSVLAKKKISHSCEPLTFVTLSGTICQGFHFRSAYELITWVKINEWLQWLNCH